MGHPLKPQPTGQNRPTCCLSAPARPGRIDRWTSSRRIDRHRTRSRDTGRRDKPRKPLHPRPRPDLVDDADLILVMDEANLADARRLATTDEQRDRIHLMGEFASDADSAGVREVPDPYGYPRPQFEEMYRQIEDAADGVVAAIRDGRL